MTDADHTNVAELLRNFDVRPWCGGDMVAGGNLLAACACALANLHLRDSGLVNRARGHIQNRDDPDDDCHEHFSEIIPVGVSLMVSGPASAPLVIDRLLRIVEQYQVNTSSIHLSPLTARRLYGNPYDRRVVRGMEAPPATLEEMVRAETQWGLDDAHFGVRLAATVGSELGRIDWRSREDFEQRHRIFVAADSPNRLAARLEEAHLDRALVHLPLGPHSDLGGFGRIVINLLDGTQGEGRTGNGVRGEVIVSDAWPPPGRGIGTADPAMEWTKRLLWLTDSDAGPVARDAGGASSLGLAQSVWRAVELVFGYRCAWELMPPFMIFAPILRLQAEWLRFLAQFNGGAPWIARSARLLLPTLYFGLAQIEIAYTLRERFSREEFRCFKPDQVLSFAKYIAHRMVNARLAAEREAAWAAEQEHFRDLSERILNRLVESPHTDREICRRFHSLPIATCREVLASLEAQGCVTRIGVRWRLSDRNGGGTPPMEIGIDDPVMAGRGRN